MNLVRHSYTVLPEQWCAVLLLRDVREKRLTSILIRGFFQNSSIEKPYWEKTADGICYGGVGLRVGADDVAKFGQMLLNGGVYNGVRFLSDEYIKDASSSHALDVNNGSADWVAGYGYQLWLNNKSIGGYRGDGAFGQLCIVLPEQKEVFVMLCECNNMQTELDAIFDYMKESKAADDTDFEEAIALTESTFAMPRTMSPRTVFITFAESTTAVYSEFRLYPRGTDLLWNLAAISGNNALSAVTANMFFHRLHPCVLRLRLYSFIATEKSSHSMCTAHLRTKTALLPLQCAIPISPTPRNGYLKETN